MKHTKPLCQRSISPKITFPMIPAALAAMLLAACGGGGGGSAATPPAAAPPATSTYVAGINPEAVAIDSYGNAWVANATDNTVSAFKPDGTPLFTSAVSVGTKPIAIAIDGSNNVWVANYTSSNVTKLSVPGYGPTNYSAGSNPSAIAIDGTGNVWVANAPTTGAGTVTELNSSGILQHTYTTVGSVPSGIAIDRSNNVWVANYGSANVTELSPPPAATRTPPRIFLPGLILTPSPSTTQATCGWQTMATPLATLSAPA